METEGNVTFQREELFQGFGDWNQKLMALVFHRFSGKLLACFFFAATIVHYTALFAFSLERDSVYRVRPATKSALTTSVICSASQATTLCSSAVSFTTSAKPWRSPSVKSASVSLSCRSFSSSEWSTRSKSSGFQSCRTPLVMTFSVF